MTLFIALLRYIPSFFARLQGKYFPSRFEVVAQQYLQLSNDKAKEVMKEAGLDLKDLDVNSSVGTMNERDVLSVLGKS